MVQNIYSLICWILIVCILDNWNSLITLKTFSRENFELKKCKLLLNQQQFAYYDKQVYQAGMKVLGKSFEIDLSDGQRSDISFENCQIFILFPCAFTQQLGIISTIFLHKAERCGLVGELANVIKGTWLAACSNLLIATKKPKILTFFFNFLLGVF